MPTVRALAAPKKPRQLRACGRSGHREAHHLQLNGTLKNGGSTLLRGSKDEQKKTRNWVNLNVYKFRYFYKQMIRFIG